MVCKIYFKKRRFTHFWARNRQIYPNYNKKNLFIINYPVESEDHSWKLVIDKIYSEDKNEILNENVKAEINNDFGLFEGDKEYYYHIVLNYFKDYINKKICTLDNVRIDYIIYLALRCDKDKFVIDDMKRFPSLKFVLECFQTEFTFTYEDLFTETEQKYFFNVIFNKYIIDRFILGKIFLRKYPMLINFDSQSVGYYNDALDIK